VTKSLILLNKILLKIRLILMICFKKILSIELISLSIKIKTLIMGKREIQIKLNRKKTHKIRKSKIYLHQNSFFRIHKIKKVYLIWIRKFRKQNFSKQDLLWELCNKIKIFNFWIQINRCFVKTYLNTEWKR
jgi:hypothetical protein